MRVDHSAVAGCGAGRKRIAPMIIDNSCWCGTASARALKSKRRLSTDLRLFLTGIRTVCQRFGSRFFTTSDQEQGSWPNPFEVPKRATTPNGNFCSG